MIIIGAIWFIHLMERLFTLSADSDENPTVITMTDNSNSKNTIKLYKKRGNIRSIQ